MCVQSILLVDSQEPREEMGNALPFKINLLRLSKGRPRECECVNMEIQRPDVVARYQHDYDGSGDGDDDDAFSNSSRNVDLTRSIVGRSYGSLDHMLT